jgi:hypothetical protein
MERSYRPSLDTYHRLRVSGNICASRHPGAIGMRWYQLSDSRPSCDVDFVDFPKYRRVGDNSPAKPPALPERIEAVLQLQD